jgi:hypothetical protein
MIIRGLGPSRPFIGVGIAGAITVTVPVSLLLLVLVSQAAAGEPPLSHHNIGEVRERVLFIGTQFSILYTFVYSPA